MSGIEPWTFEKEDSTVTTTNKMINSHLKMGVKPLHETPYQMYIREWLVSSIMIEQVLPVIC
jgi:hypothetical protein